mmetsp:Transcript_11554/g.22202  ORF Transcript_11554/g.22202 Transcript_11554/m.22202 type:complete len:80 (-) Transcript_11554:2395-2634(-)
MRAKQTAFVESNPSFDLTHTKGRKFHSHFVCIFFRIYFTDREREFTKKSKPLPKPDFLFSLCFLCFFFFYVHLFLGRKS